MVSVAVKGYRPACRRPTRACEIGDNIHTQRCSTAVMHSVFVSPSAASANATNPRRISPPSASASAGGTCSPSRIRPKLLSKVPNNNGTSRPRQAPRAPPVAGEGQHISYRKAVPFGDVHAQRGLLCGARRTSRGGHAARSRSTPAARRGVGLPGGVLQAQPSGAVLLGAVRRVGAAGTVCGHRVASRPAMAPSRIRAR